MLLHHGDSRVAGFDLVELAGFGVLHAEGGDEFAAGAQQCAFRKRIKPFPQVDTGSADETDVVADFHQRTIGQIDIESGLRLHTRVGRTEQGGVLHVLDGSASQFAPDHAQDAVEDVVEALAGADDDVGELLGQQLLGHRHDIRLPSFCQPRIHSSFLLRVCDCKDLLHCVLLSSIVRFFV